MRVVLVALQRCTANGVCTHSVANELVSRGYEVVWICNEEPDSPPADDGIEYREVRPRLIDAWQARCHLLPSPLGAVARSASVAINRIGMLRSVRSWPLVSRSYARRVIRAVGEASQDADVVVGVYTQIDAIIAAHEAKLARPSIRYVAWFLDSLAAGHHPRFLTDAQAIRRGLEWDSRLLGTADAVVAMESARNFHEQNADRESWREKLSYLDLPLLTPRFPVLRTPKMESSAKTIVYAGTLPKGIRSPEFFLKTLAFLGDPDIKILFVGDASCDPLNRAARMDGRIEVRGRVSHDEIDKLASSADCLLSIGNSLVNMTPSKIFEYMSWGKPIVATFPTEAEPSLPYLRRYGRALLLDERGDPKEAAQRLGAFLECPPEPVSAEGLLEGFWANTPMAFCDLLEELIGEK